MKYSKYVYNVIIIVFIIFSRSIFGSTSISTLSITPKVPELATTSISSWPTDGGNNYRHNNVQYTSGSTLQYGKILTVPVFSDITTDIALNTHAVPLISNDSIFWLDKHCNLLTISLPNQQSIEWKITSNFSHTAAPYGQYVPCTQSVYEPETNILYFGNRYFSTINAIEMNLVPHHTPYSPIQLPTEQTFQLLTHHSIYLSQGIMYYPLRYEYGILIINLLTGEYTRVLFPIIGSLPPLLAGSTGIPAFTPGNEDGAGVVFAVYPPNDSNYSTKHSRDIDYHYAPFHPTIMDKDPYSSLIAVNSSGDIIWTVNNSEIPLSITSRDDPITIDIPITDNGTSTTVSCIIILQQAILNGSNIDPAKLYAIDSITGKACLQWNNQGYILSKPYSDELYIVGTPALLPINDMNKSPILYYVAGHTLVQIIVHSNGMIINATSDTLGSSTSHVCTTSPILYLNGGGENKHLITVGTGDGRVLVFATDDIAKGPLYEYNLPTPSNFRSSPRIVGPFMAGTTDGSLIFIVHESTPQSPSGSVSDDYSAIAMMAIVPVVSPPEHIIPPPPPEEKGKGLRAAFIIILLGVAFGLIGYGSYKYYRRRRQRQLDLERSWYTSMAAFDEPVNRFNEL